MTKIAFIGLGNMGTGIARCVLKSGADLTVWNRTPSKMEPLIAAGAKGASSPKEAVTGADIVITSLMDDRSIVDMVVAENGLLAGMKKGAIHLCVTTISPKCGDELAELHRKHDTHYISGPVVGRPDAAESGQLTTYLAGNAEAIETVTPVCRSYAKQVIAMPGKPSAANCQKLCINYNVLAIIEMMGETYAFAEKCGVPLEYMRDFYQQALFAHPAVTMYAEKIRARDFAGRGGFVMTAGLKDARLMLSTAEAVGVDLALGRIAEDKLVKGIAAGMGETDWSATYEVTRKESGLA